MTDAKGALHPLLKKHNAKKESVCQRMESMFRDSGITREHHHDKKKFNGVNCIRIAGAAKRLFIGDDKEKGGFLEVCLELRQDEVEVGTIQMKCKDHSRMLALLDLIWSNVRGIDSGLLPTGEQKAKLEEALKKGKAHWLNIGLTTLQPKWHLTFDGHLFDQVCKFGGLADKADDSIEKFHQDLMRLRDRCRGVISFRKQQTSIRRELRRARAPTVASHVRAHESKKQQSASAKRKLEALERQQERKRVKLEQREAALSN